MKDVHDSLFQDMMKKWKNSREWERKVGMSGRV